MAVTFSDLHTEEGLKSLNEFLSGKTYISRLHQLLKKMMMILTSLVMKQKRIRRQQRKERLLRSPPRRKKELRLRWYDRSKLDILMGKARSADQSPDASTSTEE
ncbi:unnamed protein product [Trifolium pratense]|uniref:Uncharacterized protein n=1 Tax=Trifolium pratense TaxID=57577 RepID=A0ACB0LZ47_TRIPR|nr:unnamed protein product [Trifolium pratense]